MIKIDQSKEELKNHLTEQFRFIQKSSKEFDSGDVSEAKRIATHIRVLLHDTRNSKSLLLTMEDKDKILFLNSASLFNPKNLMPYSGLVFISAVSDNNGFRAEYKPLLNDYCSVGGREDWKPFNEWWEGLIIKDQQGNKFSRKNLILHVANKDGGAHVDSLEEDYVALSRDNSIGFTTREKRIGETEQVNSIKHIELSSTRQIAFEVVLSLIGHYPYLKTIF